MKLAVADLHIRYRQEFTRPAASAPHALDKIAIGIKNMHFALAQIKNVNPAVFIYFNLSDKITKEYLIGLVVGCYFREANIKLGLGFCVMDGKIFEVLNICRKGLGFGKARRNLKDC